MSQEPSAVPQPDQSVPVPARVQRTPRMHWGLAICLFLVFGVGGVGTLVAWWYLAPLYTAEGYVEVEPAQNVVLADVQGAGDVVQPGLFNEYMMAQAMSIKRYTTLDAALTKLGPMQTMYVGQDAAYNLGKDLNVAYIPGTQNISISLTGTWRDELSIIVEQVLKEYSSNIDDERKETDAKRQSYLRAERDQLRGQLEDLGRQLNRLRTESGAIVLNEQGSEHLARLTALTQQLTNAQVVLAEAEADWKQFAELQKLAMETNDLLVLLAACPEVMEALSRDPSIAAMREQVWRLNMELAGMKQRSEEKKDDIRRVEAMLKAVRDDLESARNEALTRLLQQQAGTLKGKYDRARDAEAQLMAKVTEVREAAIAVAQKAAEYREREQDYRRIQGLLDTVTNALERLRIAAALSRPNVRVSQWPIPPFEPSEPRLGLYIPAVVALGFLFALGLGLLVPRILRRRSPRGEGVTPGTSGE